MLILVARPACCRWLRELTLRVTRVLDLLDPWAPLNTLQGTQRWQAAGAVLGGAAGGNGLGKRGNGCATGDASPWLRRWFVPGLGLFNPPSCSLFLSLSPFPSFCCLGLQDPTGAESGHTVHAGPAGCGAWVPHWGNPAEQGSS
jgi:hypothetical protein